METLKYYSADDLENSGCGSFVCDDLTEQEFLENVPEQFEFSACSDVFAEAYHTLFPEALASEVFDFYRLVAHPYRRCFDYPAKSPMNTEVESAIKNKGTPGSCTFIRDTGRFIIQPLMEWMFYGNNLCRKHYYTSDTRIALLYHDIDCHLSYQTQADADAARSLIERETAAMLGVSPMFLRSDRGENGYLKVDLAGVEPQRANEVFDQYQDAVRRLFAMHGVMADFEIKGTVTWIDGSGTLHAGRYGKLPMCASRWDHRWHRSLVTARKVTVAQLEEFVRRVNSSITDEDIARHSAARERAFVTHYLPVGDQQRWRLIAKMSLGLFEYNLVSHGGKHWIARSNLDDDTIKKLWPDYSPNVPAEVEDARVGEADQHQSDHNHKAESPTKKAIAKSDITNVADLANEPDSFVRQRQALLKMARLLKRVPTVDEALKFIQDNGLFTGAWENSARRIRVRGILKFIARTFDPKKCTKVGRTNLAVNVGKYDAWAKAKFPTGIGGGRRKIVTDTFEIKEVHRSGHIDWRFISVFTSVCEYCLLIDKRPDDSLPHERAKAIWNWLQKNGLVTVPFDNRKWAVCRDTFDKLNIIKVTDRNYGQGCAMKWSVGQYFPMLGLWKTKKEPSLLGPVSWDNFNKKKTSRQHNSLLHQKSPERLPLSIFGIARPPPGIDSG